MFQPQESIVFNLAVLDYARIYKNLIIQEIWKPFFYNPDLKTYKFKALKFSELDCHAATHHFTFIQKVPQNDF